MAPAQAATAKAPARRQGPGSGARSGRTAGSGSPRRAPLRIVGPLRPRHGRVSVGLRRNPSRVLNVVSVSLVLGSLLTVVVGQALLANGQVRLSSLQNQLTLEQSSHRHAELAVSEMETPSRIVAAASAQLHMVRPSQVTELPYVSLTTPLPTPKVTPAAGGSAQTTTTSTP